MKNSKNTFILKNVTEKDNKQRLDVFLTDILKRAKYEKFRNFSRGDFIRAIKAGKVSVNNKVTTKPGYRLNNGDKVKVNTDIPESANNKLIANPNLKLEIIFEDENLIAVNKPAGLQVHPDQNEKENTLLNGIIAEYPEIMKITEDNSDTNFRPGIVHRLDKDTSGVIIIARNEKSFQELKKLFQKRKIAKKYLAIVYGKPEKDSGIIDKPLARKSNYRRQVIAGQKTKTKIRSAVTRYKYLEKIGDDFSLLEVFPKTGRTHQIRVHLFSIGNPIVGDKLYKKKNIKITPAKRQMLHAEEIAFKLFGKDYYLTADPPEDFKMFLKKPKLFSSKHKECA